MNKRSILPLLLLCFCSCRSQVTKQDIDSIYLSLRKSSNINYKELEGEFVYGSSNNEAGRYVASFVAKDQNAQFIYLSHSAEGEKDTLVFKGSPIAIKSKLDPLSIKVYTTKFNQGNYVAFTGNAQSASGSGQQVTFFVIIEVDKRGKPIRQYEFSSRFGSINNLIDYNRDGSLDYFKIVNGKNAGEYLLTVNDARSDSKVSEGYILLKYELNDQFTIVENRLSTL